MQLISYAPSIVLVLGVIAITMNFFFLLSKNNNEGFINVDVAIAEAKKSMEDNPPTNDQMAGIYKSFLLYIKSNSSNGLAYVQDLNQRVYGQKTNVSDDFDPRRILDNYKNPITGL